MVMSSVVADVFLVLLNMGSLAAGESFVVVFIPSCTTGFGNLGVLCMLSFLPSQDSLPVLCILSIIVGTPTSGLLVFLR